MSSTHSRKEFRDYERFAPAVTGAIAGIGKAVAESRIEKELLELIKIRASQINGCAYCLQIHLNTARKIGIDQQKIDFVAVWQEATIYSERELAALGWTELVSEIAHGGVSDEAYVMIHEHFSESEVAYLTAAIIEINAYNRLGNIYRFTPPKPIRQTGSTAT